MIFRTGDLPFDRPDKDKDKNKKKDEDDIKFKYIIEENYELYWKEIENKLKIEDDLSPDFKDLLWKMVSYDPNKRISARKALGHNWFFSEPIPIIAPFSGNSYDLFSATYI